MSVTLGIPAFALFFIPMFEHNKWKMKRYKQEELLCRIDALYTLLSTQETAPIAFMGLYLTRFYKDIVFSHGYDLDLELAKTIANKSIQIPFFQISLTDEWAERGVKNPKDYAILTNDIMQGAFDVKVADYKKIKGLEREN